MKKMAKISFHPKIRKLQKKLSIRKKRYAEIVNSVRAVVTYVNFFFFFSKFFQKRRNRIFFGCDLDEQTVVHNLTFQ